eukprot:TRINITY_DN21864_c0_g1_i1.p1 TRINITY_DN21864_c0_g1~~TRINITY_DN21864_c0_g1_i1.p1  ORF type:complete len:473 (+),score=42.78 TRINITY_DN21864_c0_g1_i1:39-1457(+)
MKKWLHITLALILGGVLSSLVTFSVMLRSREVRSGDSHISTRLKPTLQQTALSTSMPDVTKDTPAPSVKVGASGKHMSFAKLLNKGGWHQDPEEFLPYETVEPSKVPNTKVSCIKNGMQRKCLFSNFMIYNNTFFVVNPTGDNVPNPIYPADGLVEPLLKYHKYKGHKIQTLSKHECTRFVDRPIIFLFRMSGHSTYHLWENNLGPFHQTLQDFKPIRKDANDVTKLLVSFIDYKPIEGPKAPYLLDTLLQSFTDLPLINASRIYHKTCFKNAIVGVASKHFDHFKLLNEMRLHIANRLPPKLPKEPKIMFVSRNHPSVIRGRKISNEAEVMEVIRNISYSRTGAAAEYVHLQDYNYQDQVNLVMDTQIVIGPHGGGIANCIWMQKGSVVMEMASPAGKDLFGLYHTMCRRSEVTHLSFVASPDPSDEGLPASAFNNNKRLYSNLMIPVEQITKEINRAIDTYYANYKKLSA